MSRGFRPVSVGAAMVIGIGLTVAAIGLSLAPTAADAQQVAPVQPGR
jgi:hypothetical protein